MHRPPHLSPRWRRDLSPYLLGAHVSLECLQPLGGPRAHAGRPGDWRGGQRSRHAATPRTSPGSAALAPPTCPANPGEEWKVPTQAVLGGLLGGGCRWQQSEPARRPTEAPQGGSGVALQRRVGSRGGVRGAGLRDMGVECWAGPDGEGRSAGRGRWGKGRAARRSSWGPHPPLGAVQGEPDHPQGPCTGAVSFPSLDGQDLLEAPTGRVEVPQAGQTPGLRVTVRGDTLVVAFYPFLPALPLDPQAAGTRHSDSVGLGLCRNEGRHKS